MKVDEPVQLQGTKMDIRVETPCASTMSVLQPIILTTGLLGNSCKAGGNDSPYFALLWSDVFLQAISHAFAMPRYGPLCLCSSASHKQIIAHFCSEDFGFAAFAI